MSLSLSAAPHMGILCPVFERSVLQVRKIIIALVLLASFALLPVAPVFANVTWEDRFAELEKEQTNKEMIRFVGDKFLAELREEAPQGTELDLWKRLWVGVPFDRAAAGAALMYRVFPDGDPGRWEEARGFLSNTSYKPRQLAGMDAFFVTVAALDEVPGGEHAAAFLLNSFSKSARGMIYFIEQLPQGLQVPIASIVAKTSLRGDWSARSVSGSLPLLPVFRGSISRDVAESRRLIYLDGAGRIAGNGYYAWDRNRGYLYRVVEDSERFWQQRP